MPRDEMSGVTVKELVEERSARALLAVNVVGTLALCAVPLFGVHGVESAFSLGLLLPILSALHTERVLRAAPGLAGARPRLLRGVAVASLHMGVAGTLLALNALRVQQCEALLGLAYMALGPYVGCLLSSTLVVPLCALTNRTWVRPLLAVSGPVLGFLSFGYSFYFTPAVFAYGHFFGYFPGSFYDEQVAFPGPLLWLRLGTACALLSIGIAASLLHHPGPFPRRFLRRRSAVLLILAALFFRVTTLGPELGFAVSEAHVQKALGTTLRSARCVIHAPREYADRHRFAEDCDVRVGQMERFFGLRQRKPVTVYLFRSSDEKRSLIGAAGTNIAKPWRREVYVQLDDFPHTILGHEIAHVVVGDVGVGPFRVSGSLGGLWPNPGIVEGAAVAADFRARSGLTPHQWAKAALESGRAPSLESLFGSGFFAQQASLSYTMAGSFLRFVVETEGRQALLRLYRMGDLTQALSASLSELEQRYHAFLSTIDLPADAAALARERFSGIGVLSAICPHKVADLQSALSADLRSGDFSGALTQCDALLEVDPTNVHAAAARVAALSRSGDLRKARAELLKLADTAPTALVAEVQQSLADAMVRAGQVKAADAIYLELISAPHTENNLRQLQVKRLALAGSERQRELLFDLLVGREGEERDPAMSVYLARELRGERADGLPHYLEARQLYFYAHYREAAELLEEARALGLPTTELADEAERVLALCRLAHGDLARAAALYRHRTRSPSAATRYEAHDFLQRIALLRSAR